MLHCPGRFAALRGQKMFFHVVTAIPPSLRHFLNRHASHRSQHISLLCQLELVKYCTLHKHLNVLLINNNVL